MQILFIHQNFPAQFGQLALFLAEKGWDVHFATAKKVENKGSTSKITIHEFSKSRDVSKNTHHYLHRSESAILNAQAFARLATGLKTKGINPNVIVAHSGWGSGSLSKSVWPECKFVQYLEWWYNYPYWDRLETDPPPFDLEQKAKTLFNNLPFYTDWIEADITLLPTMYQASALPKKLRQSVVVHHDGIDTEFFRPRSTKNAIKEQYGIPKDAKLLTYATRGMEPHLGFPQFMEAWQNISRRDPSLHCIIAGSDTVHYGPKNDKQQSYKEIALSTLEIDPKRTHFVGRLPFSKYRDLLCASDCHVYLTLPFVLSWSLLEAMSCAAPIVSNSNAAVEEVLENKVSANLVNLQKIDDLTDKIEEMLKNKEKAIVLGNNAREKILNKYCSKIIFPQKEMLFRGLFNVD